MKTVTLGSFIQKYGGLIQTGPFGSQLHQHDYTPEGIPVVMPKDIRNGRIDENTVARIPEQKAQELSRHSLKRGSIVFPRRGEISKCAYVEAAQEGFLCGTGCIKIEVPEAMSSRFLFYYLGLRHVVEWLERNAVGTTMLNLNTSIIGGIHVPDIPISRQHAIASTLSAYDYLIQNNEHRITLLEQLARLLYEEWFVRLRFPGYEHVKISNGVPDGWTKKHLFEISEPTYGFPFRSDFFNDNGKGLPVARIRDIISGSSKTFTSEDCPDEKLLRDGDFVIGMDGDFHMNFWIGGKAWINQRVVRISPFSGFSVGFLRYALEQPIKFYNATIAGTTVAHLGAKHIEAIDILLPPQPLLNQINEMLDLIRRQIVVIGKQCYALASARDLLLPRLMSGEIVV